MKRDDLKDIEGSLLNDLERYRDRLEDLVQERWAELVKINDKLREEVLERKRTEEKIHEYQEELRSMVFELSLAEERERRRIAAALHSNLGNELAISKMKLNELWATISSDSVVRKLIEIVRHIDNAIHATRSLTYEISPPLLYEVGLEAAVEWLVARMNEEHDIQFSFYSDEKAAPLDEKIQILLFSCIRELLVNVIKHARAARVKVALLSEEDSFRIVVEDDGQGFDPTTGVSRKGETRGFGLFSIRERMHHLGGDFEIDSGPEMGCRIVVTVPVKIGEEVLEDSVQ